MRLIKVSFLTLFLVFGLASPHLTSEAMFKYDHHGKRDPFIPLVDKDGNLLPEVRPIGSVEELRLEGVLWDREGESYAIISGSILKVGDMLADYKLVKIERKAVILTRAGEEVRINLNEEEEY